MKKSLLAVAAIGAFASAAQAQSSVTVYGILDVGFQGVTTRGNAASSTSTAVQNPVAGGKSNQTRFTGEGSESTSRLGFKGTEDLGGGTSAFFTAEFALAPTDATLSGQYGNGLFNRQTFVGLKKNGIGQAAIGTQYTIIHEAVGATDPGQQNNIAGNVIYATSSNLTAASNANSGHTDAYTVRTSNMLKLVSDQFYGFKVTGTVTANNQNNNQTTVTSGQTTTVTGGVNNQNGWGLGVDYTWQKLLVTANYQAFTSKNPYVVNNTTGVATPFATWSTATGGSNVQDNQAYIAATYDFGILKAYAQYVSNKVQAQATPAQLERTAQQIGVRSFVTPTIEAWASAGTGRFEGQNLAQSAAALTVKSSASQNFTGYQLGSNYWLSKRTNMYAIFGSTQVSGSSVAVSEGGSSYGVGVRHTF